VQGDLRIFDGEAEVLLRSTAKGNHDFPAGICFAQEVGDFARRLR
jgi:hypothetical protein